jgi:hypothetical protein
LLMNLKMMRSTLRWGKVIEKSRMEGELMDDNTRQHRGKGWKSKRKDMQFRERETVSSNSTDDTDE